MPGCSANHSKCSTTVSSKVILAPLYKGSVGNKIEEPSRLLAICFGTVAPKWKCESRNSTTPLFIFRRNGIGWTSHTIWEKESTSSHHLGGLPPSGSCSSWQRTAVHEYSAASVWPVRVVQASHGNPPIAPTQIIHGTSLSSNPHQRHLEI